MALTVYQFLEVAGVVINKAALLAHGPGCSDFPVCSVIFVIGGIVFLVCYGKDIGVWIIIIKHCIV